MTATVLALLLLAALAAASVRRAAEALTPTLVFAAPWALGLAASLARPWAPVSLQACAVVSAGALALFAGEAVVRAPDAGIPAAEAPPGEPGPAAAAWYWGLVGAAVLGAAWKLRDALAFAGGDLSAMVASSALRGAVTSSELAFSPAATTLVAGMYLAAALTGFLCRDRLRARYLAQLVPAVVDSLAVAGRGSFLIVGLVTLAGLGVGWRGPRRQVLAALAAAGGAALALALGLSFAVGRGEVLDHLWEYAVGPLHGLAAWLRAEPGSGIRGPALIAALTGKLGGATYQPGDFVWTWPFTANVNSGFRELLGDAGTGGLALLLPVGAGTLAAHRAFRRTGGWAPYAAAVALYAWLGYFYYVSLGAFLPAWWLLLLSAPAAAAWARIRVRPPESHPGS